MARDYVFTATDGDADMTDKPHALVRSNWDGSHAYRWDLSDAELLALYDAISERVHGARYRVTEARVTARTAEAMAQYAAEVASGRIREMSEVCQCRCRHGRNCGGCGHDGCGYIVPEL